MLIIEIISDFYDDEELEFIFGDHIKNNTRIKEYYDTSRIPEKYRIMPKSKTIYRGIYIAKTLLDNYPIALQMTGYSSFSTSPSEALEFAQGVNYNPFNKTIILKNKMPGVKVGIVYSKRPTQDEIIINLKLLPFAKIFKSEKEILINTRIRTQYWSTIDKNDIIKITKFTP